MSELPDKIKTHIEMNWGSDIQRPDREILDDLVYGFNKLLEYLEEQAKTPSSDTKEVV